MFKGVKLVPTILLFLVAPVIAELLSGNMPLGVFFNPSLFIFLTTLYGSGALLMRELKVRWNKGIVCLLLLGVVYGVIEEGMVFSVFFTDAEQLIVVYHAIFSIAIPVLLVEMFAERLSIEKNECWLDNLGFGICATIFIGTVIFGAALAMLDMSEPKPHFHYPVSIAVASIFTLAARVLPSGIGNKGKATGNSVHFFIIGLVWSALFFMLPHLINLVVLSMFVEILWIGLLAFFLSRYSWNNNSHRLSLIGGLLFFLIPFFVLNFLH